MDPLTAVGLAGNIVQFVHFSCSLVSKTSDIHHSTSGQTQENVELDLIAKELSLQCAKIQQNLSGSEDASLSKLALACQRVSDDLISLIARIRSKSGHDGKWTSFRQAVKSVLKSEDLRQLNSRLDALRSQMNAHILVLIRCASPSLLKIRLT